jgi:hypothetical protein
MQYACIRVYNAQYACSMRIYIRVYSAQYVAYTSIYAYIVSNMHVYSPHSKLTPLVWFEYAAQTSMLLLCLGSTNTMKGIILCVHKLGSYAYTHRNEKKQKNVTLETHPDNMTR